MITTSSPVYKLKYTDFPLALLFAILLRSLFLVLNDWAISVFEDCCVIGLENIKRAPPESSASFPPASPVEVPNCCSDSKRRAPFPSLSLLSVDMSCFKF